MEHYEMHIILPVREAQRVCVGKMRTGVRPDLSRVHKTLFLCSPVCKCRIWRPREFPKEPQVSYVVVRELLGPHEQAYIARDRSDINLGQGQGS